MPVTPPVVRADDAIWQEPRYRNMDARLALVNCDDGHQPTLPPAVERAPTPEWTATAA